MTPLAEILARQIAVTGPITVAEYMAACLMHPQHGYYTTRDPLGAAGDFVTAPEISQMFGELVGLALAQAWLERGRPDPFVLAELGPGRGTLMADALRATRGVRGFHDAMRLALVEVSAPLRAAQALALAEYAPAFCDTVDALPDAGPLFLVANEFFDALPVRQFLRDGDGWRERMVGLRDDALAFALAQTTRYAELEPRLADTQDGDTVETSGASRALAETVGARIAERGGVALMSDYGQETSLGDTFQAVRDHEKESPLAHPGQADLTAHVDFGALAGAAPCAASTVTPQGVWLERLGITDRARALARGLAGEALDTHVAAHRRLTHPDEMGHLFKVMSFHDEAGPPPGLEAR
ncbi:class I SAM-dependent methyltransferase [Palleronia sp.]|uniref:class I SAM-dependent methyltransferase n=1 Tax=Palleronia sp. TaxID=1940284 RepID=UPI0035C7BEDE